MHNLKVKSTRLKVDPFCEFKRNIPRLSLIMLYPFAASGTRNSGFSLLGHLLWRQTLGSDEKYGPQLISYKTLSRHFSMSCVWRKEKMFVSSQHDLQRHAASLRNKMSSYRKWCLGFTLMKKLQLDPRKESMLLTTTGGNLELEKVEKAVQAVFPENDIQQKVAPFWSVPSRGRDQNGKSISWKPSKVTVGLIPNQPWARQARRLELLWIHQRAPFEAAQK